MTEEIKFEKALEKLEKIVEDLESGTVDLEEALKKYEEGVRLSAICQKRLAQAEKKVEVLTKSLDGSLKQEAFDPDEAESVDKKSRGKTLKKEVPTEEEDLLI